MSARIAAFVVAAAVAPLTASMPVSIPEHVGLSSWRLARIGTAMERAVAGGAAGVVAAVARRGRIAYVGALGSKSLDSGEPPAGDLVFDVTPLAPPIVSVAVLMLFEEGSLRLDDPVSGFIPECANMTVVDPEPPWGVALFDAPGGRVVPPNRQITIRDLLTQTSGLGAGTPEGPQALTERVVQFCKSPLETQPGSRFAYRSVAAVDTLRRILEIVSGQRADDIFRSRVFQPLGMQHTFFSRCEGGECLFSSVTDYLQFGQMLLNGGELDGVRLLGPRTVDLMHSAFVEDVHSPIDGRRSGRAFGLGVEIVSDPNAAGARVGVGTFGWADAIGSMGAGFWVDPIEHIVGVVYGRGVTHQLIQDIQSAVMQATVD